MYNFINKSESLELYDRTSIHQLSLNLDKEEKLLIHVSNDLKGVWIINIPAIEQSGVDDEAILGGYIIQTDISAPIRD